MANTRETGKFRKKHLSFTATSNRVLFDENLDMDTRTLHSMINYYLSIPDFTLYKAHIQKKSGVGQTAFNRMWKQLKENGYLVQYKLKGERGVFYYEYELFDEPQLKEEEEKHPEAQNEYMEEEAWVQNQPLDNASVDSVLHAKDSCINNTLNNKPLNNKNINKQQQPKEKEEVVVVSCDAHLPKVDEGLIEVYKSAFGRRPSQKTKESLVSYLTRFDREVVIYALELAGTKGKGFDYAQGVFIKWWENGVKTFDDVFEYEERYRGKS